MMLALQPLLIVIIITLTTSCYLPAQEAENKDSKLADHHALEQRLIEIDDLLGKLVKTSLRDGIGSVGHRSITHDNKNNKEWVKINLGKKYPITEVVLAPIIHRNSTGGFIAEAFPSSFRVIAGTDTDPIGTVIADYPDTAKLLPRTAPLVINIKNEITASWIKIETTQLGFKSFNQLYIFQLSEVLVFSGEQNVALGKPVKVSSTKSKRVSRSWNPRFLTDGSLPYLMDTDSGKKSLCYLSKAVQNPFLIIDLDEPFFISGVHLHITEQNDTVPRTNHGSIGMPLQLKIEGSNLPDFSDSVTLLELKLLSRQIVAPLTMLPCNELSCRYVRIIDADPEHSFFQIGFAEIELLERGNNVALGKTVTGTRSHKKNASLDHLTDGSNPHGKIIPLRAWMHQLQLRHDLENERPLIIEALTVERSKQTKNLRRAVWVIAILLIGSLIMASMQKISRQRAISKTRESIAANLHDELGANLYAIGLFANLANQEVKGKNNDGKWNNLLQYNDSVCTLTKETAVTASHCTNLLLSKDLYADLPDEMDRLSSRLLADIQHTLTISDEELIHALPAHKRNCLFLFYKECLTNILRHSSATEVETQLAFHLGNIHLSITDNGAGLADLQIPKSLKRRARLLKGKIGIIRPLNGGTKINLTIRAKRSLFPLWKHNQTIKPSTPI